LNYSKKYQNCFDFLTSLREEEIIVNINNPLCIPPLIVRNYLKPKYGALRLSKTGVIVSQVVDINCQPKPLQTIYLYGPDLVGEKEAIKTSNYFMSFQKDWVGINNSAWETEIAALNHSRIPKLTSQFEEYPWLEDLASKIDGLATEEIIGMAYDISLNRSKPNGSMKVIELEAFSKIAINTIVRNFMRANNNSLLTNGFEFTPEGNVTIDKTENFLTTAGYEEKYCLKIGPSNNLLTYIAIYLLNMYGWKANIISIAYLLACHYLRCKTLLNQKKSILRQTVTSSKTKTLKNQVQFLEEEVERLEKAAFKVVRKSIESLIDQGAIIGINGSYVALGDNIISNYSQIALDPYEYNYLFKSIMYNIREINEISKELKNPHRLSYSGTHYTRPNIYIASTCHNFRDLRQELKQSLRQMGYTPWLNEREDFPVTTGVNSYQACVEAVKQADCLVLIIGNQYGGIVKGQNISITELEYETACENNIPRINFCLDTVWNLVQVKKANPNMEYPKFFSESKEKVDKIFEFLDRVRKYEIGKTDNWVHIFKNSVDLKKILRKRLEHMNLRANRKIDKDYSTNGYS